MSYARLYSGVQSFLHGVGQRKTQNDVTIDIRPFSFYKCPGQARILQGVKAGGAAFGATIDFEAAL